MKTISRTKQLICSITYGLLVICFSAPLTAGEPVKKPDELIEFKVVEEGKPLSLHLFKPKKKLSKPAPCIVFFFGGGWVGGSPAQFYQQSAYFAEKGFVCLSAQYRTKKSHGVAPDKCVEDGKSAIRWVRKNAEKLGIDPKMIVAAGGSAGGHVAACTGVVEDFEAKNEDLSISSKPNAMLLFNPVLDTSSKGYGEKNMKDFGLTLSPCHLVKKGIVPTLVMHGTADSTVPFQNAERYVKLMQEAGNHAVLKSYEGKNHGFFNGPWMRPKNGIETFNATMADCDAFLKDLKILPIAE